MGVTGIQEKVASHIAWAGEFAELVRRKDGFELFEPQNLGLVCFRLKPAGQPDGEDLNNLNRHFLEQVNASGRLYMSHTSVNGNYILRFVVGQTNVTREHVLSAWDFILHEAETILIR